MNQMKIVAQNLPKLWKENGVILYVILLMFLTVGVFWGTSKLIMSYQDAQEIKLQIATMNNFLNEWTEKTTVINNAPYRPIKKSQIDDVQKDILFTLQAHKLDVIGFKAVPLTNKEDNSRIFEIEFSGSYESTIHFLNNFHAKDALMGIHYLKMEPKKGIIKTVMQYKIYVK